MASKMYNFPVIAIGNLSTGGTGKTPMTEYVVEVLKDAHLLAVLSRGYGRKTRGYILADSHVDASIIGDEPFQIYSKFNNSIRVAVDEYRRHGIEQLRALKPEPEVIVLDDAFQHRKVTAGFYILLTAYNDLYVDDYILPTGNLREPIMGAKRATIVVVTKCPKNLALAEKKAIGMRLKLLPHQQLFFSTIQYSDTIHAQEKSMPLKALQHKKFTLVTGIADASSLITFLKENGLEFEHLNYKDHHIFSEYDLKMIEERSIILTTEKDYVRLVPRISHDHLYYLPIRTQIDRQEVFESLIKGFVAAN
jgi:tetraacyldisaccharide 4'-kinase